MPKSYDVIVVGVGGVGSAVCYQLAKRGVKVLGLERFAIPHAQGGTHGYSRQTKIAAYIGGVYEPLVRRSYELYRELIEEARQPEIMVNTGFVDICPGQRSGAYQHDSDAFDYLDHAELQGRFPQFHLPEDYWGALDPAGALLHPELAITSHVRQALTCGAEIHGHPVGLPVVDGHEYPLPGSQVLFVHTQSITSKTLRPVPLVIRRSA